MRVTSATCGPAAASAAAPAGAVGAADPSDACDPARHPDCAAARLSGLVKWFDSAKGFGFISDPDGFGDVLLHGNVLRKFGRTTLIEGTRVIGLVAAGARGRQFVQLLDLIPPPAAAAPPLAELSSAAPDALDDLPLWPARVKWFDKLKGFGFATVFGLRGDIFLHIEVIRQAGFVNLAPGEAIGLRVLRGERGLMAAQLVEWEQVPDQGDLLDALDTPERERSRDAARPVFGPGPAQTMGAPVSGQPVKHVDNAGGARHTAAAGGAR